MTERWVRVPSFSEYMVSDQGRIRRWRVGARILKGSFDKDGYHRVCLGGCTLRTHAIVAEAFHGPRPAGLECAHLDGDHRNNKAANLAWATPKENASHKIGHGTNTGNGGMPGERHPNAKLTAEKVEEIRAAAGSTRAIAARFGIAQSHVVRLRNGKRWAGTASPEPNRDHLTPSRGG